MRLVPKNLRNYLQTPTLIGCKFLTITEATLRLLRSARCDQRSLVVYHGFLSTVKLFRFPLLQPARHFRNQPPNPFQRSLRLCTDFSISVNFEEAFLSQPTRNQLRRTHRLKHLAVTVSRALKYMPGFKPSNPIRTKSRSSRPSSERHTAMRSKPRPVPPPIILPTWHSSHSSTPNWRSVTSPC